jgi:hypothetical protein
MFSKGIPRALAGTAALVLIVLATAPVAGAWWVWGTQPCDPWEATAQASAQEYTAGWACPAAGFASRRGYQPVWVHHGGAWRVGDPAGACTSSPDRGWYFDFRAACQVHDYCYDLGRERYPNVWKADCDRLLHTVALEDCAGRGQWRPLCATTADSYYLAVRSFGLWWFHPERWN